MEAADLPPPRQTAPVSQAALSLIRCIAGVAAAALLIEDDDAAFYYAGSLPAPAESLEALLRAVPTPGEEAPPETARPLADGLYCVALSVAAGQGDARLFLVNGVPFALTEMVRLRMAEALPLLALSMDTALKNQEAAPVREGGDQYEATLAIYRQNQDMLSAILNSATDAIYIKDEEGRYLLINQAGALFLGQSVSDVVGKTDDDLFPHDIAEAVREQDRQVVASGTSITIETVQPGASGEMHAGGGSTERTYLVTKDPFHDQNGSVVGLIGIAREITDRKQAEAALISSEERYRLLFDNNPCAMWVFDPQTLRFLAINDAAVRQYGYSRDEFLTMTVRDIRTASEHGRIEAIVRQRAARRIHAGPEMWRHRRKDGREFEAEIFASHLIFPDGTEARLVLSLDVSDRVQAQRDRQEYASRFEYAFEGATIGMAIISLDGAFLQANAALCAILDYEREELLDKSVADVVHPDDLPESITNMQRIITGELERCHAAKRCLRSDGSEIRTMATLSLVRDPLGVPRYFMAQVLDITEQYEAEQRLRWQAYHDTLTGLANRYRFEEELAAAIGPRDAAGAPQGAAAVLLLDLDRFKRINDTLGHLAGDQLIQSVGRRLADAVPEGALVSRMGGDEFTVLMSYAGPGAVMVVEQRARDIARRLLDALAGPESLMGHEIYVGGSVGISLFPNDGQDPETLLKHADVALYRAKEGGRGAFQFYNKAMNAASAQKLRLESALRRAVERDEFTLAYQPQVEILSGHIIGVEALCRWRHPDWGLLLPSQFLSLADETGLSLPLDKWALREACRQAQQWHSQGLLSSISVNLSARQFAQREVVNLVERTLEITGLPPHLLDLEMTETTIMESGNEARERLLALKNLGVRLSVDDFGTGYSSLSYLRYFPLDVLKIDRAFVENLPDDLPSRAVVRTLVELAQTLGLFVIAEGVERPEQQAALAEMGCDAIQGYLISPAVPPEEMLELLQK